MYWSGPYTLYNVLVRTIYTVQCTGQDYIHCTMYWSGLYIVYNVLVRTIYTVQCTGQAYI